LEHFLNYMRSEYPFSIELLKHEKFFKDLNHKPLNNDPQTDGFTCYLSTYKRSKITVVSLKKEKEYGDNFNSFKQCQKIFGEKEKITNFKVDSRDFIHLMLSMRVAKGFISLKQRSLVMMLMLESLLIV